MDYSSILKSKEYDFLHIDEHLGKHVILLGLAGSYSYGTNNENSDIDVRGIALNRKSDLIGMTAFEQYVDNHTDTTIYSFRKMINLLLNCNPNTVELLGLNPEHYLFLNGTGKELIQNSSLFLSKRAIQSFGGYADAQLRRLQNALARDTYPQREKEQHIYNSVKNAMHDFKKRYTKFENGAVRIYIDKSEQPDYDKIGKRNRKKDDNHLNKHAMHLLRLFMMAIDILGKGEINTYRKKEHELLVGVRRGEYQRDDGTFREEFYDIVADYEKKLDYAAKHTILPDEPDMKKVQEFVMEVNEKVVRDEI